MIKHFKAFGKEFDFKGLKKEIEFFERILGKLTSIKSYKAEQTGIIGLNDGSFNAEHTSVFYVMFGQHQLRDEEGFNKKVDELLSKYHNGIITLDDLAKFRSEADSIFNDHVCTEDKRRTPEQYQQHLEEMNKIYAKQEAEQKKRSEARAIERERIVKEYAYLLKSDGTISSRILATKNIRLELNAEFPEHKFSITSDTFSGGDSIDVRWTDGVTEKEVNEIIRKYQEGHFDGMQDMYVDSNSVFNDVFGGAKFVHANRELTRERYSQVGEELGYHLTFIDDRWNYTIFSEGKEIVDPEKSTAFQEIRTATYNRSFYSKPEKSVTTPNNIQISSGSGITIQRNHEHDGIEIKFPGKPEAGILSKLKANGFRWNHRTKVWYKKYSENALIFAQSLTNGGKNNNKENVEVINMPDDVAKEFFNIDEETTEFERGLMQESARENER